MKASYFAEHHDMTATFRVDIWTQSPQPNILTTRKQQRKLTYLNSAPLLGMLAPLSLYGSKNNLTIHSLPFDIFSFAGFEDVGASAD